MDESKVYGFHTTFFAKSSSQALEIPRWYINHLKMKTPSKAYLKGPRGGTWAVELVRKDGRLYLQQGWLEFQKCHSLHDTDLLVFEYDDKVNFNVKLYKEKFSEENEERLEVNAPNTSLADSGDAQSQYDGKHETKEHRAMDSLNQDSLSFVKTMKHYNVRQSFIFRLPAWFVCEHFSGYGEKIQVILENTSKKQWPATLVFKSKILSGGWSKFVCDNEIKEGDTCKFELVHRLRMLVHVSPKKASSQVTHPEETQLCFIADKKRRVNKYGDDNEAGEHRVPQSVANDSPSFTMPMKHYNIHRAIVNVNTEFVSTYCCNYGQVETITLENEQGKQWSVTMYRQRNGGRLASGWPLFVRDNQIKENDTCTFTLVNERKMLVYISRHSEPWQPEEDIRAVVEHPTHSTDPKGKSGGLNKRKRGKKRMM